MAEIAILNKETIEERIRSWAKIGFAAAFLVGAGWAWTELIGGRRYDSRVNTIQELIKEKKIGEAKNIVQDYKRDGKLHPHDVAKFMASISAALTSKRVARLNELIEEYKYEGAVKALASYEKAQELPPKIIAKYRKRLAGEKPTLEFLVGRLQKVSQTQRGVVIHQIAQRYPTYSGLPSLRKEQLDHYLAVATSQLKTDVGEKEVLEYLANIHTFVGSVTQRRGPNFFRGKDYSAFFKSADAYIERLKNQKRRSIEIGDTVVFYQNLGPLGGEEKNEYYGGDSLNKFPLGEIGIVTGKGESLVVKYKGETGYFRPRELKHAVSAALPKIQLMVDTLQAYLGGKK